ncbi:hypothetical protein J5N97_021404 [Dioscorea zingiberensis]|uniref:Uncharacterized protein n=1 Tax=Dioscorea zingiberensis TaxID=325984 RepID=A0A9D5CI50_9LILI|nr:hypothetical protein J5N97_021404 [Dioscorea zingiberensis]
MRRFIHHLVVASHYRRGKREEETSTDEDDDSETDNSESEAEAPNFCLRPQYGQGGKSDDESEDDDEDDETEDEHDPRSHGHSKYASTYNPYMGESDDEEDEETTEDENDPRSHGYSKNANTYNNYMGESDEDDEDDDEDISRKLGKLALGPHAQKKKKNDRSQYDDDRKVMIIKDLHLHMSHNTIGNFAWNKKEKIYGRN